MTILSDLIKPIKEEADREGEKLLSGQFKDYTEAKALLGRRNGLLRAIELIRERAKHGDDPEDL